MAVRTQTRSHHPRATPARLWVLLAVTAILVGSGLSPVSATETQAPGPEDDVTAVLWYGNEQTPSHPYGASGFAAPVANASDPLGLVPKATFQRRYSLDVDHLEVWTCGPVSRTHSQIISRLEATIVPYFSVISNGEYSLEFVAGGHVADDSNCVNSVEAAASAGATANTYEAVFIVDTKTNGGYASPGWVCATSETCSDVPWTYPDNARYAVVGESILFSLDFVAAHEIGHTLHWPHSYSGLGGTEYDNPIDVMSANSPSKQPLHTIAYNRYQSGWIDVGDVEIYSGEGMEVTLAPQSVDGTQLLVIPTGTAGSFYALGARVADPTDPIPSSWDGVEVYLIDQSTCNGWPVAPPCPSIWRDHYQTPPAPFDIEHVLHTGEAGEYASVPVSVKAREGDTFSLVVGLEPGEFLDTQGTLFEDDIAWLALEGITKGCNPPANTLFCPDDLVTRGQVAAFLVRALEYSDDGGGDRFVDDDDSVFEADIDKLATAGVTIGCNPPVNDRFCPDDRVTRGQFAAFLVRALEYSDDGGGDQFVDDDDSVFEADIDKLATAGVASGCNPPVNDRFCPGNPLTRGQVAAFLHRALG